MTHHHSNTLKGLALFLLFLLCNSFAYAQEETSQPIKTESPKLKKEEILQQVNWDENKVYSATENTPAQFEGGMKAFAAYISANYKVPGNVEGPIKIVTAFVIDLDGSVVDIKIIRSAGHETSKEMIRVLKASPKWKPGLKDGIPVRTALTLPINF
ncbi:energy transducer TonB [Flavobacterium microcysteis]|uniref:TonB C-terminal domain-containing protein n=1 Tax=Flavobacterium microcysteis TaxID=2596891 RepID=A0A501Q626_9FLAO|nr:energy transducer TonB [Flavobacterium microcysteis]TPD68340.1 hypothetical protein FJA49_09755 [Flavobacterium microcysteis]